MANPNGIAADSASGVKQSAVDIVGAHGLRKKVSNASSLRDADSMEDLHVRCPSSARARTLNGSLQARFHHRGPARPREGHRHHSAQRFPQDIETGLVAVTLRRPRRPAACGGASQALRVMRWPVSCRLEMLRWPCSRHLSPAAAHSIVQLLKISSVSRLANVWFATRSRSSVPRIRSCDWYALLLPASCVARPSNPFRELHRLVVFVCPSCALSSDSRHSRQAGRKARRWRPAGVTLRLTWAAT